MTAKETSNQNYKPMKTFNYAPASPDQDQLTMLAVSTGMIVVTAHLSFPDSGSADSDPRPHGHDRPVHRRRPRPVGHDAEQSAAGARPGRPRPQNHGRWRPRDLPPCSAKERSAKRRSPFLPSNRSHYDEEEGELRITLADGTRIVLDSGFFDSTEQYDAFCALLKK